MTRMLPPTAVALILLVAWAGSAAAQTFDAAGTRAAGMGGAFVAVADDASAAYWNPAGFAAGSFFSLVLDRTTARLDPNGQERAGSQSAALFAIGAPALGLSYYRLRATTVVPASSPRALQDAGLSPLAEVRLDTLVTHHTGATLVQSLGAGLAVGATLKLVRGTASSVIRPDGDRRQLLDDAGDLVGRSSNAFDADIGIMASGGPLKAGLTIRNLLEPGFRTSENGNVLSLERQARAGLALTAGAGWVVAADLDLLESTGPRGTIRELATGAEGRIARKALIRGGVHVNTIGSREPALSAGGSYFVTSSLVVDGQVTRGTQESSGWGISARFVF